MQCHKIFVFRLLSWIVLSREYRMIYRGPGFLAVVRCGSSPALSPLPSFCNLSLFLSLPARCQSSFLTEEVGDWGGGGGRGAKSYDGEKAWSSINHSILSGLNSSPWLSHESRFSFFCKLTNIRYRRHMDLWCCWYQQKFTAGDNNTGSHI